MRLLAMLLAARAGSGRWPGAAAAPPRRHHSWRRFAATQEPPPKETEIIPIELEDEMADSFMKYALSTILEMPRTPATV